MQQTSDDRAPTRPVSRAVDWFSQDSPQLLFPVAGKMIPWFGTAALALCAAGFYIGFFVAPSNAEQGEVYRIVFLHLPAAWMSMLLYILTATWATLGLIFNTRLSAMMASALAPTGAMFTFLALWTGSLWGKPSSGAWWVWDARLTSELILLFLYLGFMTLQSSMDDARRADRAGALLVLVGLVNIPVIYFSVLWWNTLHQGAAANVFRAPGMAAVMLGGMLVMAMGFWAYSMAASLIRLRAIMLERDHHADWVRQYIGERS